MADRPARALRRLLAAPEPLMAPGVADALNARLVAEAGFEAVYMTGAGTSATRLGMPDVGLLTMPEMVDNAQRIADASGLPLIADADTGYGGPINVQRTVRAFERAGAAAIHLEDQVWPKRCGHLAGKALIDADEMVSKVRAAVDARHDADFIVIARTDALAVEGFEQALERGKRYEEAGADAIFIEAPRSHEELRRIPPTFSVPSVYNMASSGKTPLLPVSQIGALGFRLIIYPNFVILAAIPAVRQLLRHLRDTGAIATAPGPMASFVELFDLLGMDEVRAAEARFAVADVRRAGY